MVISTQVQGPFDRPGSTEKPALRIQAAIGDGPRLIMMVWMTEAERPNGPTTVLCRCSAKLQRRRDSLFELQIAMTVTIPLSA